MKAVFLSAALLAVAIGGASAQHAGHAGSDAIAESPSTAAFRAANARMHADMDVELTGDADIDFVRSMIPHHQGAIEMARILIEHGEDPELISLAEEIVAAQEAEIAEMRDWLAANDPQAGGPVQ